LSAGRLGSGISSSRGVTSIEVQAHSLSLSKILHYGVLAALGIAALAYWLLRPPSLNPVTDPQAAEALALVQTHRATSYPSILQAFNERVRVQKARNLGVRLGEWRVQKLDDPPGTSGGNRYQVRINLREEGANQWFEREFIWHVDLSTKRVNAASLPADGLMPEGPDSPGAGPSP
jgi:hypothetical protein